jgi:hypothetical protein
MNEYKVLVRFLSENKVQKEFLNSDQEHALEVFINLFRQAQGVVRIFAGCLCNDLSNSSEYIVAISDFIEKGGKVKILLSKYDESLIAKSNLMRRLSYYSSPGEYAENITIKATKQKFFYTRDPDKKEIHFTVADENAYRIETNIEQRSATCNFNNPRDAKVLVELFDRLYDSEEPKRIDLVSIFTNKQNNER